LPPLDRQLRLLRAYGLVTYPFACVPFLFLFFRQHGCDQQQFGVVIGVYYVAMFVAEVPTGLCADRFGGKPMLVLGPLILTAGFLTLLLFPGYGGFLAGEALLGFGHAVLSGPPSAMLYETLRAHGQQHRYLAEEAKVNGCRLYGTGSAFLLGGLVAWLGNEAGDAYGLTIALTCAGTLAAAGIGTLLTAQPARLLRWRDFVAHAATDLVRPAVLWLLAYWVVLFALLRYPFHNYQPYLHEASAVEPVLAHPLFVGGLFAVLNLVAAPLSGQVPRLVRRWGRGWLFFGMPLVLAASLLVMSQERAAAEHGEPTRWFAWLGVSMFFVQQVPFGMHTALVQEFVNHRIGSHARTTVLSVLSLGARLVYAGCNVALFWSQQENGMGPTLWWAGLLGIAATVLVMALRPHGLLRGEGPVA